MHWFHQPTKSPPHNQLHPSLTTLNQSIIMATTLSILAPLFLSLLFATATAYRTIVTTVIDDEGPLNYQQSCREQMQHINLRSCQVYLTQGSSTTDDAAFVAKPLERCCNQMKQMDRQCRCVALRELMRQQQQEGQMSGEELSEMRQRACRIAKKCGMGSECCQGYLVNDVDMSASCEEQVRGHDLSVCENYLARGGRSVQLLQEEYTAQRPERCCEVLRPINRECRCEAVKRMVSSLQEQMSKEEAQRMQLRACKVASRCDMSSECACQTADGAITHAVL